MRSSPLHKGPLLLLHSLAIMSNRQDIARFFCSWCFPSVAATVRIAPSTCVPGAGREKTDELGVGSGRGRVVAGLCVADARRGW